MKSGYKLYMTGNQILDSSSHNRVRDWWKTLPISSKIKVFMWRVYNDCLPTRNNLSKKGIELISLCPICSKYRETTDHSLFRCKRAKQIWKMISPSINLTIDFHNSIQDRCLYLLDSLSRIKINVDPSRR